MLVLAWLPVVLNLTQVFNIIQSPLLEQLYELQTTVEYDQPLLSPQIDFLSCKNQTTANELGFLHIPKTGGSSIESTAKELAEKRWGYFAWESNKNFQKNLSYLRKTYLKDKYDGNITGEIFWHVPLSILSTMIKETTPYDNQDLFAVIRNPFSRVVSEVFYRCSFRPQKSCFNKKDVNTRLRLTLTNQLNCVKNRGKPNMDGEIELDILKCFLEHGSHFIPQWFFFYDPFSGERDVRYLVHFENLAGDFHDLMAAYSLNISLNSHEKARKSNYNQSSDPDLFKGVQDLDETTKNLILELYDTDFDLGGYSRDENSTASFSFPSHWVAPSLSSSISANETGFWELPCYIELPTTRMDSEE